MKRPVRKSTIIMTIFFLTGLALVLFPFVSNQINDYMNNQLVDYYQKQANKENEQQVAAAKEAWDKKNQERSAASALNDPFKKTEKKIKPEKSYFQEHTIAYLDIPKINSKLPVFDGTNDFLLEKGAGLLEGSSFLSGGPGTHAVISAHRGLPTAKLFTDLPKLAKGDLFIITVNNEKHAYEVDHINIIEPDDTQELEIIPGKDYVTLFTCTPYMVNTHRLLVRGKRVAYTEEMKKQIDQSDQKRKWENWKIIFSILAGIGVLIYSIKKIVSIKNKK